MLALTRRVGEEIVIGDPRQPLGLIRVVEIHGDKVRLSFDFPRDTSINRKELADLKLKQEGGAPPSATSPLEQAVRAAVRLAWSGLPAEQRNLDALAAALRPVLEQVLAKAADDPKVLQVG